MERKKYTIILFYKFTNIKNPESFKLKQRKIAESFGLIGRMLIAKEGINATFEGTTKNVKSKNPSAPLRARYSKILFLRKVRGMEIHLES